MPTHKKICDLVAIGYQAQTGHYKELEYHCSGQGLYYFITVRGSETSVMWSGGGWRDWVRDFSIMPWYNDATGWAHWGFLKGALGIFDQLRDGIDIDKPIILSGHSLGGGVTLLLAQILFYHGYNVKEWIGFGTPKAFIGYRDLGFPTFNYRHGHDPVPKTPLGLVLHFRHPAPLIQLDDVGSGNDHSLSKYQIAMESFNFCESGC